MIRSVKSAADFDLKRDAEGWVDTVEFFGP